MAPRGKRPKPAQIKELEGNREKLGRNRIKANPAGIGAPEPPKTLSAKALGLWHRVVSSLPVGLLTQADEGHLERYAVAWTEFQETCLLIRKEGMRVERFRMSQKGVLVSVGLVLNPLIQAREMAAREMHRAGADLGLSPVSRARMTAADSVGSDPMELLLGADMNPDGAWSTPAQGH
jgi:P27 family predicted phage terminase small subunit